MSKTREWFAAERRFGMGSENQNNVEGTLDSLSELETLPRALEEPTLLERVQQFRNAYPVITTVVETAVVYAGNRMLRRLGEKYGINFGHGRQNMEARSNFINNHPVAAASLVIGVAPTIEEFVFRKLPSDALDRKNDSRTRWDISTVIGVGFMAMHAGRDAIPLPQFVGGQHLWRVQREKGYKHAVLAHATYNALGALNHVMKSRKR